MNTMHIATNTPPVRYEGFASYISRVSSYKILTETEETSLFQKFQQNNDLDAAREIIMSHLRFVVHIAKSYTGYGLPLEDLIQEGNIGLMKSVKRFDLSRGVRLAPFAVHWIKAEIHEFIMRNWRLVRVATTKAQRKLFFNLRKKKQSTAWLTNDEAQLIAEDLGVKTSEVLEMESRLHQNDCFFEESFGDNLDDDAPIASAKASVLEDKSTSPDLLLEHFQEESVNLSRLKEGLTKLDPRSRDIIEKRWLQDSKTGLQELASAYGISAERVRQIEVAAMKKIKKSLQHSV